MIGPGWEASHCEPCIHTQPHTFVSMWDMHLVLACGIDQREHGQRQEWPLQRPSIKIQTARTFFGDPAG